MPKYITAQKMKFSIKDFFSKCDKIRRKLWISQFSADFITFTGEILNGKFHILCSDGSPKHILRVHLSF